MSGLVVVGSVNVDRTVLVRAHPRPGQTVLAPDLCVRPGGKGANQAVAAARAGAAVRLLGRVGEDTDGSAQLASLRRRGVDVTHLRPVPGTATGTAHITVDHAGENSIVVHPGANAALALSDVDAAAIEAAAVVLIQLEIPLAAAVRAAELAAAAGVRVVLNASPAGAVTEELLRLADPVVVNEHELAALGPLARSVCVTLGAAGARWGAHTARSPKVDVVDTTGAGDCFAGTLAAALAEGRGEGDALRAAVEAGALACTWRGAQPPEELV